MASPFAVGFTAPLGKKTQRDESAPYRSFQICKTRQLPSLVGNAQTRIIIIKGRVSPTYLFSLSPFILFSSSIAKQNQGANIPILLLSPLLGKSHKYKPCLSTTTRRLPLHTLAESFLEKGGHPKDTPTLPLHAKSRQAYCYTEARYIQPSLTSSFENNIMSCGQKVTKLHSLFKMPFGQ